MTTNRLRLSVRGIAISGLVQALLAACSDESPAAGGSSGSSPPGSSGATPPGGSTVSAADCHTGCVDKSSTCGAPADVASPRCSSLCSGGLASTQLSCLTNEDCESLGAIETRAQLDEVCPPPSAGTPPSSNTGGKTTQLGGACKCQPDSSSGAGNFECSGDSTTCIAELRCIGSRTQGVDEGICVGPKCCDGEADCEGKYGTQASCSSGQKCQAGMIGSVGYCRPG